MRLKFFALYTAKLETQISHFHESLKRAVRKVSSHFEYLENRSGGLDVTWQPVRGDLTERP